MEKKSPQEKKIDPKKFLMDSGHFDRIEYPSQKEMMIFGEDILGHYRVIEPMIAKEDRYMLRSLVDYVKNPIIVDDFPSDDIDRNAWQNEYGRKNPEVNKLLETNRLKGNLINQVLSIADLVKEETWLSDNLKHKTEELYIKYKGPNKTGQIAYDLMPIEEKIAFTKELAIFAKELYQAMVSRVVNQKPLF